MTKEHYQFVGEVAAVADAVFDALEYYESLDSRSPRLSRVTGHAAPAQESTEWFNRNPLLADLFEDLPASAGQ